MIILIVILSIIAYIAPYVIVVCVILSVINVWRAIEDNIRYNRSRKESAEREQVWAQEAADHHQARRQAFEDECRAFHEKQAHRLADYEAQKAQKKARRKAQNNDHIALLWSDLLPKALDADTVEDAGQVTRLHDVMLEEDGGYSVERIPLPKYEADVEAVLGARSLLCSLAMYTDHNERKLRQELQAHLDSAIKSNPEPS